MSNSGTSTSTPNSPSVLNQFKGIQEQLKKAEESAAVFQRDCATKDARISQLEIECADLESTKMQLGDVQARLTDVEAENRSFKAQISKLVHDLEVANMHVDDMERERSELLPKLQLVKSLEEELDAAVEQREHFKADAKQFRTQAKQFQRMQHERDLYVSYQKQTEKILTLFLKKADTIFPNLIGSTRNTHADSYVKQLNGEVDKLKAQLKTALSPMRGKTAARRHVTSTHLSPNTANTASSSSTNRASNQNFQEDVEGDQEEEEEEYEIYDIQ